MRKSFSKTIPWSVKHYYVVTEETRVNNYYVVTEETRVNNKYF